MTACADAEFGHASRLVRACRQCLTCCFSRAARIPSRGSRSSKIILTPRCQRGPGKFHGAFAIERVPTVVTDRLTSTAFFSPIIGCALAVFSKDPCGTHPPRNVENQRVHIVFVCAGNVASILFFRYLQDAVHRTFYRGFRVSPRSNGRTSELWHSEEALCIPEQLFRRWFLRNRVSSVLGK